MEGTEDNNTFSRNIDEWNSGDVLRFIHLSDIEAYEAISKAMVQIDQSTEKILSRMNEGGRVIYVGAGTSGRLAAQDVAELWPTYGIDSSMFDYIMAGGKEAISHSVEGAEDSRDDPITLLNEKSLNEKDIVFGITASGSTPFVLSSLKYAKSIGALSIGMTNNRQRPVQDIADVTIILDTGPEVIQGSTRMKAGTAQKMVLGMISTTIAVKLGFTYKNTMSNMGAWYNNKLRNRAVRMVVQEFGLDEKSARDMLEEHDYKISEVFSILNKKSR